MTELSQADADAYTAEDKSSSDTTISVVHAGDGCCINLQGLDSFETFKFDVTRGRRQHHKISLNLRVNTVNILVRLCTQGSHSTPDDVDHSGPHIHLYREGYGDAWIFPVPACFSDIADPGVTLKEFTEYIKIITPIHIQPLLFP